MYRSFVKQHAVSLSILLFMVTFFLLQQTAPSFLYKKNGHIRKFWDRLQRKKPLYRYGLLHCVWLFFPM